MDSWLLLWHFHFGFHACFPKNAQRREYWTCDCPLASTRTLVWVQVCGSIGSPSSVNLSEVQTCSAHLETALPRLWAGGWMPFAVWGLSESVPSVPGHPRDMTNQAWRGGSDEILAFECSKCCCIRHEENGLHERHGSCEGMEKLFRFFRSLMRLYSYYSCD